MADGGFQDIALTNVGGDGVAAELFGREWDKVLENVADPNTEAEAKREVILKITVEPNADREQLITTVQALAKLAPTKPHSGIAYLGHRHGVLVAVGNNPRQKELWSQEEDDSVRPINAGREERNA